MVRTGLGPLVQREGKRVRLFTRNGRDGTDRFSLIAEGAAQLGPLVDGGPLALTGS